MRLIPAVGLAALLLTTACGQPSDLASSAPASETSVAASTSDSAAIHTTADTTTPLPCPTSQPIPAYPSLALAGATPTSTPVPTPTIDPEVVPVETAPGGLGTITLLKDDATVRGIFAELPETIGNYTGTPVNYASPYYIAIQYDDIDSDRTIPRPRLTLEADRSPDDTPAFPNQFFMPSGTLRRDGQVFYASNELYRHCYWQSPVGLLFTTPDTPWKFYVQAGTQEEIELLLSAFVQTVNASPAPIPYVAPTPWPIPTPRPGYPAPEISVYPPPQNAMPQQMPTATPTSAP